MWWIYIFYERDHEYVDSMIFFMKERVLGSPRSDRRRTSLSTRVSILSNSLNSWRNLIKIRTLVLKLCYYKITEETVNVNGQKILKFARVCEASMGLEIGRRRVWLIVLTNPGKFQAGVVDYLCIYAIWIIYELCVWFFVCVLFVSLWVCVCVCDEECEVLFVRVLDVWLLFWVCVYMRF